MTPATPGVLLGRCTHCQLPFEETLTQSRARSVDPAPGQGLLGGLLELPQGHGCHMCASACQGGVHVCARWVCRAQSQQGRGWREWGVWLCTQGAWGRSLFPGLMTR